MIEPSPRKRWGAVGIILAIVCLFLPAIGFLVLEWASTQDSQVYDRARPYEQRVFVGPSCRIRVSASKEIVSGFKLPRGSFMFECTENPALPWRPVFEFAHDSPGPILDSSVSFVGDRVVVAFMGWKCAVSSDAGRTWHLWNAETDLPEWREKEGANYRYIQEILMNHDGRGTVVLNPAQWTGLRSLVTTDYGKTWVRTSSR